MMKYYGLLGRKLSHSLSPQIHSFFGNDNYACYEVEPDEVEAFLRETCLSGMNVTVPYKKTVMKHCAKMSEAAQKIGSVNTLVKENDGWHGYNTDYDGFIYMVRHAAGYDVCHKKGVILGDGGAAASVRTALNDMGADEIVTVSRKGPVTFSDRAKYRDAGFIVQTTPVGMYPGNGQSVLSLKQFDKPEAVFDLIYNPAQTSILAEAENIGIIACNGLPMLVAQAAKASELFTGVYIKEQKIREAIGLMEKELSYE